MSENLEIERKFLVRFPDISKLNIKRCLEISQIYLNDGENGSQRRVRRVIEDNLTSFIYTEKIFYSAIVRNENEYEISEEKYNSLLSEKKIEFSEILKSRVCFEYKNQFFELDIYPFSKELAILELELENEEQEIFFPEYIEVIKEVTGIKSYSNASLGNAGKFPENI